MEKQQLALTGSFYLHEYLRAYWSLFNHSIFSRRVFLPLLFHITSLFRIK
jgi:hypothetical protein